MSAATPETLGVTLLLLDRVLAAQEYQGQTIPLALGTCSLSLVSLATSIDAYLVLKIDADADAKDRAKDPFQMVLSTDHIVEYQPAVEGTGGSKYRIQSAEVQGASISLTLPPGCTEEEEFHEIIEQSCGLVRGGTDQRGSVEVVDEKGNVIGSLDRSIQPSCFSEAFKEGADPLVIILDEDDDASSFYSTNDAYPSMGPGPTSTITSANAPPVFEASKQEKDWLINGAHYVSKGLIGARGWLGGTVEKGANRYASGKNSRTASPGPASFDRYLDEKSSTGLDAQALSTDYPDLGGRTSTGGPSGGKSKTNVPIHSSISKGLSALSSGSAHVVNLSGTARTMILNTSDNAGRRIGGIRKSTNKDGTPREPGTVRTQLQRGAQAANIILDGFDTAAGGLLNSVGASGGKVVGHTFGPEAQTASGHIGKVGKNCFLVYKDVSGIRRRCLLKLAGGTLKGRTDSDASHAVVSVPQSISRSTSDQGPPDDFAQPSQPSSRYSEGSK